ncbi:hypothetical protein BM221_006719 [Beauveria bassiana]|uniref:Uncharacterized protein n=1 Tax=Beauveria bassiana TaxID=176275 RepID=A0A2N6NIE2_BEABA|nr:hypothetical protein BM221_006719 [Beauveria bassiana]
MPLGRSSAPSKCAAEMTGSHAVLDHGAPPPSCSPADRVPSARKSSGADSTGQFTGLFCSLSSNLSRLARRIVKLGEPRLDFGIRDRLGPLVKVAADELLHLRLEAGGETELVAHDHVLQVGEAAGEGLEPARGALQLVGRADVEHEEAVDEGDDVGGRHVLGKKGGVFGVGAAVAADEDVEALFRGNEPKAVLLLYALFTLRFCTLAHAAAHATFNLVRRAYALVPLLQPHRQPDGIPDAVAAPGRADAALDSAQRLCVCVARLEAGGAERGPDGGQVLLAGAKEVDALAAGDFGVEAVALGDAANGEQLGGRDLAAGDARDDRVGAVALDVAEVAVVGVLKATVGGAQDVLVPEGGKDAGDGGFAELAAHAAGHGGGGGGGGLVAGVGKDVGKGLVLLDHDDIEEVGAHERHAPAAPGAGFGTGLDRGNVLALAALHLMYNVTLGDVVAGANLRVVVEVVAILLAALFAAHNELAGRNVELLHVLDKRHNLDVVARVANHHAS